MTPESVNAAFQVIDKISTVAVLAIMLKFWTMQYVGIRTDLVTALKEENSYLKSMLEERDNRAEDSEFQRKQHEA